MNGPAPSRSQLIEVFDRLHAAYGPRNWWPADGPFEVAIGAILTQNTGWRNVERALANLRAAGIWSIDALHRVERDHLAAVIRPSGYFNTKARKLQEFATLIAERFAGDFDALLALPADELRTHLLGVWGIGEETADDIVLYAAGKPSFVIDAYTRRIVDRLGWHVDGSSYADYKHLFESRLPTDAALFNEYHALIDRHGSTICRPQPRCAECALLELCPTGRSRQDGTASP